MSKKIKLSNNLYATVDDEDFEYLSQWKWHSSRHGNKTYAARNIGSYPKKRLRLMHREILNPPNGFLIDHKDGNGLNNQKSNIRVCTHLENNQNQSLRASNKLGLKGVRFREDKHKFCSQIRICGKKTHLGYFDNALDAAYAYDKAAKENYGEFALVNFPD